MVRTLKAVTDFAAVTATVCFQLTYTYQARKPGMKEMITGKWPLMVRGCDTAGTLKIGINTIIRTLKTRANANNFFACCPC